MHRLNSTEYNATVADVLGTSLQPANGSWRGGELAGFDNIASVLGVDEAQYKRYFDAAQALATEVLASDKLRARFVSCDLTDPACVIQHRRRPGCGCCAARSTPRSCRLTSASTNRRARLGDDEPAAFTLVLQALLSSAEFLYRIELDPDPESTAAHPARSVRAGLAPVVLSLEQRARRRACSMPLRTVRLLQRGRACRPPSIACSPTSKSRALRREFRRPMAGCARSLVASRRRRSSSQWSRPIAQAASEEILLYFSEFLRSGRSWFEFPTADVNFVDARARQFYGMPSDRQAGRQFERVEVTGDKRAGFFGLAGFLALRRSTGARRPHFAAAGSLSNLLCSGSAAAAAGRARARGRQPGADGGASTLNVRESLEQHRQNPGCAACHGLFDPYGLALEEYDAIGLYRRPTTTARGRRVGHAAGFRIASRRHGHQGLDGLVTGGRGRTLALAACLAREAPDLRPRADDHRRRRPVTSSRLAREWLAAWTDAQHSPPDPRAGLDANLFRFRRGESEVRTHRHDPLFHPAKRAARRRRGARAALARVAFAASGRARRPPSFPGASCPSICRTAPTSSGVRRPRGSGDAWQLVVGARAVRRRAEGEDERRHQPRERFGLQRRRHGARRAEPRPPSGRLADLRRRCGGQSAARARRGQRHLGRSGDGAARQRSRARRRSPRCRSACPRRSAAATASPARTAAASRGQRHAAHVQARRSARGLQPDRRRALADRIPPAPPRSRRRSAWPSTRACSTRCSRTRSERGRASARATRRRMDEFLESVRGVEKRVAASPPAWGASRCAVPASTDMPRVEQSAVAPRQTTETYDKGHHADAMNDLIVMAFECDVTRVITYMLEDERSEFTYDHVPERAFTAEGSSRQGRHLPRVPHGPARRRRRLRHHHLVERRQGGGALPQARRHRGSAGDQRARQLRRLLRRLHARRQPQGDRLPVALLGGGNLGLENDQHIVLDKRPLRDLYFTLMNDVYGLAVRTSART